MDINIQVISVLASIGVLILIWRQLRLQTKQAKFDTLTQIHQEVCTQEFRDALAIIFSVKPHELSNSNSQEIIDSIGTATGLYDLVGVRVQEGVLPKRATLKTEWKILVPLWDHVKGFVYNEREQRGLPYKEHFEWLAGEAKKYWEKHYPDSNPMAVIRDFTTKNLPSKHHESQESKLVYSGNHLNFYVADGYWEFVSRSDSTGGVIILAVTDQNEILFVEQYRAPIGKSVIELPAGLVGDTDRTKGEDFVTAVKRELQEETGFDCKRVTLLCQGPTLPGLTDEINGLYLAEDLTSVVSHKFCPR